VTHYASGTWSKADVSGVTMCEYDLRLTAGEWRIETEACNSLAAQGDPRGRARLAMAGVAFAATSTIFLVCPAFG